ncbi:MAG: hypothetical protein MR782_01980 [Campylobacter sp.]|uniref:PilX N-terminal domain-containing pilus assembly protein n=1 Tax=Campylobacter sp. TaxID=205 RepID=UPI002A81CEAB|nr:PilX N-terminal domain-containing pilus assembly protein [Campylobacter sp.]MCI6339622.1 hypothetical protein [Campylobacter sp.]MDY4154005.1 hypothetical protein [Campylobacter sp.]
MKKGFSLILAIIFILLVASIGALSMSISSSSAKTSVNLFIHEQAKLLADGAVEYAIMKVQQNDFATTCVDEIEINYPNDTNPTFRANISITYIGDIGDGGTIQHCANQIVSEKKGLQSIIISGQVRSLLENSRENLAYSFTTTQIP